MTEAIVAAKFTAIIAFAALLLVMLMRLIKSKATSSADKLDLTEFIPVQALCSRTTLSMHQASRLTDTYVRPTFKSNSSEDDLIAGSFKIKGISILKDDLLEYDSQHATKLTDSFHIGI